MPATLPSPEQSRKTVNGYLLRITLQSGIRVDVESDRLADLALDVRRHAISLGIRNTSNAGWVKTQYR